MISPPDPALRRASHHHLDELAKPLGAMGRLEDLAAWMAACQGKKIPHPLRRPRCLVLAGDHGVVAEQVSAHSSSITAAMVTAVLGDRAGVNALASISGTEVEVLDISCTATSDDLPDRVRAHRLSRGCPSILRADAMSPAECARALATGELLAARETQLGTDLLIVGDLGIGNTTPATAMVCALTGADPREVTGPGAGLDEAALGHKREVVAGAIDRVQQAAPGPLADDPLRVLSCLGSPDLAVAVGLMIGAARRGIPMLVDGLIACAEALVAERAEPGVTAWMVAGHRSAEPAASVALDALGLEPLLDLRLRLGEGSGAVGAVPLVQQAIAMSSRMARLDELG